MAAGVFSGIVPQGFPHRSTGATLVQFGTAADTGSGDDASMMDLGYCEDRVQIDERPQWEDIKNDIFGGMAGVHSDVQYLGSIVYVHCNLNRFNHYNIQRLSHIHPTLATAQISGVELTNQMSGTTGDIVGGTMGAFMRQGDNSTLTYMETLCLSSATEKLRFHRAFLRQGRRFNMGVRHQQVMLVFECHIYSPCDCEMYGLETGTNPCL